MLLDKETDDADIHHRHHQAAWAKRSLVSFFYRAAAMQARSSYERLSVRVCPSVRTSVRLSVRPCVCQTREL